MCRQLLLTAAVVAIALAPPIGVGTAEAHGEGSRAAVFVLEALMAANFATTIFLADENFGTTDFGLVVSSVVIIRAISVFTIQATMDMELAT